MEGERWREMEGEKDGGGEMEGERDGEREGERDGGSALMQFRADIVRLSSTVPHNRL